MTNNRSSEASNEDREKDPFLSSKKKDREYRRIAPSSEAENSKKWLNESIKKNNYKYFVCNLTLQEARETVVQLALDAGMKAWHAGVIANSIVAEAMTSSLIFINNRYKIDGAGLRITGQPGTVS